MQFLREKIIHHCVRFDKGKIMAELILKKGGLVFYKRSDDKERFVDDILPHLGFKISLEDGYSLRDMFLMVSRYPDADRLDPFLQDFIDEFLKCPLEGCVGKKNESTENYNEPEEFMDAIYVQKSITYTVNNKYEDKDTLETYLRVGGRAAKSQSPYWAIEYTPLKELLDYPIVLFDCYMELEDHNVSVLAETWEYYKTTYTLWELIHSIIWELSFLGTPVDRNEKSKELDQMTKDIKDGKLETIPLEDFKDLFLGEDIDE